jgi:hypothetical protein
MADIFSVNRACCSACFVQQLRTPYSRLHQSSVSFVSIADGCLSKICYAAIYHLKLIQTHNFVNSVGTLRLRQGAKFFSYGFL